MPIENQLASGSPALPSVDGAKLRALREAAQFEISSLAQRASLSAAQLRQLENGESSLFYSLGVRLQAARKVAAVLGVPPDSFIMSVAAAVVKPGAHVASPQGRLGADADSASGQRAHALRAQTVQTVQAARPAPAHQAANPGRVAWIWMLLGFGVVAALLLWWMGGSGSSAQRQPVQAAPGLQSPPTPLSAPPGLPAAEAPGPPPTPPLATSSAAPLAQQPVSSQSCGPGDDPVVALQALRAFKSGAMVYVVGTAGQVLCVRDAAGQVWQHVFALDGGRTFEGAPPWQLQSPQLASMEIYFQGWRVRPPEAATTRVSLQEIAWR